MIVKIKNKAGIVFGFVLLATIFCSSCTATKEISYAEMFSEINNWIIDKVKENAEDTSISRSDIVIDQIYYGSFSQKDVNLQKESDPQKIDEILVLCKLQNTPHAGGLDRTAGLLLSADSMEVVAYHEFAADKVIINCLHTNSGENRVLFLGTTTYQGISTQEAQLYAIKDGKWIELPISNVDLDKGYLSFVDDNSLIVTTKEEITSPEDILEVLIWNQEIGQFVLVE